MKKSDKFLQWAGFTREELDIWITWNKGNKFLLFRTFTPTWWIVVFLMFFGTVAGTFSLVFLAMVLHG